MKPKSTPPRAAPAAPAALLVPLALLLAAATPLPAPAASPTNFSSLRPILSQPVDSPQLAEIRLDSPLFAATRPGLPDLRLFDSSNREIPRLVEPLYATRPHAVRLPVPAQATDFRELPGNRIEAFYLLDDAPPSPLAIQIQPPLRDFIRTVRVSGSSDGQTWTPLVVDAEIFDYSRYVDVRRTEISVPSNAYRRFSIEISNASEERAQPLVRLVRQEGRDASRAFDLLQTPFRIQAVSFLRETTSLAKDVPVLQDWPHSGISVENLPDAKTTAVTLQTDNAPLSRLVLESPDRNFQRSVELQVPAPPSSPSEWRTVASGQITRVDLPGYSREDLAFDFPETRSPRIRLLLRNADNPPVAVDGVRPYGPSYRLLWLAEPRADYLLAAGHPSLPPPQYDLFAVRTALEKGVPPVLRTLADPGPSVPPPPPPFSLSDFLSRPAVFGSLLPLAALALLLLLAKALKKAQ